MEIAGQDAELPEMQKALALLRLAGAGRLPGDRGAGSSTCRSSRATPSTASPRTASSTRSFCRPCAAKIRDRKGKVLATVRPSYNLYVTPRLLTSEGFARLRAALGMNGDEAMDVWERVQTASAARPTRHAARAAGAAGRGHLARGDGRHRDGRRDPGREDRLGAAPLVPAGRARGARARLHERGLGRRAAREEGRGLPRRRSRRPHRASSGSGRATCAGAPASRRSSSTATGCPSPTSTSSSTGRTRSRPWPGTTSSSRIDADVQTASPSAALRNASAAAAVVLDVDTGRVLALVSKPGFDPNEMSGHLTRRRPAAPAHRPLPPAARQDAQRDLLPGLDVQGGLGARGARGPARHAGGAHQVPRVVRDRAAPLPLHEDARRGRALRRHRAELQRLLLRARRAARHDGPPREVRRRPRPGRAHRPRPQRRGRRLRADRGVVPRAEAREPQGRGLPGRAGAQRRHRPGLDARDARADGDALRGDRERRQAVAAADRRPRRGARRPGARGVRRRACGARSPSRPRTSPSCARRWWASSTSPRARPSRRARRRSRSRARRARRRCTAATPSAGGYEGGDHAWFVGFAPAGRPKIALAVLVEHGGHGGDVAAPVAMEIVDNYFDNVVARGQGRAARRPAAPPSPQRELPDAPPTARAALDEAGLARRVRRGSALEPSQGPRRRSPMMRRASSPGARSASASTGR